MLCLNPREARDVLLKDTDSGVRFLILRLTIVVTLEKELSSFGPQFPHL